MIAPIKKLASEIDALTKEHYFEFIKWIQNDCEFWYDMYKQRWYDAKTNKKYTLDELYNYWLENYKKK